MRGGWECIAAQAPGESLCPPLLVTAAALFPLQGYHGDTSRMFYVGEVAPEPRRLCEATKEALNAAIKVSRSWCWGLLGPLWRSGGACLLPAA